jgi:hypothetical protein
VAASVDYLHGQAELCEWIVGNKAVEDVELGQMGGEAAPGHRVLLLQRPLTEDDAIRISGPRSNHGYL